MKIWTIYNEAGHPLAEVEADTMFDAIAAAGPEARIAIANVPFRAKHARKRVPQYNHNPLDVEEPRKDDQAGEGDSSVSD